jgi:hypothetical protein
VETLYFRGTRAVRGKPSKLKDKILKFLAINGKCSKTDLTNDLPGCRRYYADISESVDDLKRDGYIKVYDKPSDSRPDKKRIYYVITEKGLNTLLSYDGFDVIKFWEILDRYYQNADAMVTSDKFQEFYQIVIGRCLKYPAHGFSLQLDIFDGLCNKLIEGAIKSNDGITPLQKVIEILASYPRITFEELVEKTDLPKELIGEILLSYSFTSRLREAYPPFEMLSLGYIDFLSQNIIITSQQQLEQQQQQVGNTDNDTSKQPTYELSLFGLMLCLVIIRYNNMGMLKYGLYRESSFETYYDRIVLNHRNKLPLIFGKWNQLKVVLKEFAYYNFDIILNKEIRSSTKDLLSVSKGGNKQLIEGIREIISDNEESTSNFRAAGCKILEEKVIMQAKALGRYSHCGKLQGLQVLSDPFLIKYPVMSGNMMGFVIRDIHSFLKRMEESFADEIFALYYMNLYNDSNIRVSEPPKHCYHSKSFHVSDKTPKESLLLLLEQDKEKPLIKEWLARWRDDLVKLQSQVLRDIKTML